MEELRGQNMVQAIVHGELAMVEASLALPSAAQALQEGDPWGRTPFHHAVLRGLLPLSLRMLQAGAPVNARDIAGAW